VLLLSLEVVVGELHGAVDLNALRLAHLGHDGGLDDIGAGSRGRVSATSLAAELSGTTVVGSRGRGILLAALLVLLLLVEAGLLSDLVGGRATGSDGLRLGRGTLDLLVRRIHGVDIADVVVVGVGVLLALTHVGVEVEGGVRIVRGARLGCGLAV
jgi:hypothetical protein